MGADGRQALLIVLCITAGDGPKSRYVSEEHIDHVRIEMPPPMGAYHRDHFIDTDRPPVYPAAHQGIEHIGQGHEARRDGDGVAGEAIRITAAIPALVVRTGNLLRNPQDKARAWDDLCLAREVAAGLQSA